ncbi:MAG: hypothetical protein ACUVT3_03410, partial [Ignavibacterium sp.]
PLFIGSPLDASQNPTGASINFSPFFFQLKPLFIGSPLDASQNPTGASALILPFFLSSNFNRWSSDYYFIMKQTL